MIKINPWLGSELAFVADSGLWIGHGIALAAGNRYKGESRNAAILHSTKNAQLIGAGAGCLGVGLAHHTFIGVLVFRNHTFIIYGWKSLQSRIPKTPPLTTLCSLAKLQPMVVFCTLDQYCNGDLCRRV